LEPLFFTIVVLTALDSFCSWFNLLLPSFLSSYVSQDELAEQTLKATCRKFSGSAKVWLRHISWLLTKDRADAARKVLDKSFTALPQRKHIKASLLYTTTGSVSRQLRAHCLQAWTSQNWLCCVYGV